MMNKPLWLDGHFLHVKGSSKPIDIFKLEDIFVKKNLMLCKVKRAFFIAIVFSFVFFLWHPTYGVAVFCVLWLINYLASKQYELRVLVFNNPDIGHVESAIHTSNDRELYDEMVKKIRRLRGD